MPFNAKKWLFDLELSDEVVDKFIEEESEDKKSLALLREEDLKRLEVKMRKQQHILKVSAVLMMEILPYKPKQKRKNRSKGKSTNKVNLLKKKFESNDSERKEEQAKEKEEEKEKEKQKEKEKEKEKKKKKKNKKKEKKKKKKSKDETDSSSGVEKVSKPVRGPGHCTICHKILEKNSRHQSATCKEVCKGLEHCDYKNGH